MAQQYTKDWIAFHEPMNADLVFETINVAS